MIFYVLNMLNSYLNFISNFCYFWYLLNYRDSEIPKPPEGHRWKEVRHDNTVTWLCSWTDNILGSIKYIMLNPSSKIKVIFGNSAENLIRIL